MGLIGASMDDAWSSSAVLRWTGNVLGSHRHRGSETAMEELKQYCLPSDTFRQIAALLTERSMLG